MRSAPLPSARMGRRLASGSADKTVRVWNLRQPTAAPTVLQGHDDAVLSVAFSPDGQSLASGSRDKTVRLWNLRQPTAAPTVLQGHDECGLLRRLQPGWADAWPRAVRIRRCGCGTCANRPLPRQSCKGTRMRSTPSPSVRMGRRLASGSADKTVRLWNLRQPTAAPTVLQGHDDWVSSVAFSPDGQTPGVGQCG